MLRARMGILAVIIVFFLPVLVFAIVPGTRPGAQEIGIGASPVRNVSGLLDVAAGIVKVAYIVFFTLAVLIFVFVAFTYLTAAGDAAAIKKAHDWLMYGAIAVVVALLAVGLSAIIENFLKNPNAGGGVEEYGGYQDDTSGVLKDVPFDYGQGGAPRPPGGVIKL